MKAALVSGLCIWIGEIWITCPAGLPSGFLATLLFAVALSGFGSFLSSFKAVLVGMDTELVPVGFREIDAVVLRSLFDVREGQGAIGLGNIEHLIEARHGVADVLCIG